MTDADRMSAMVDGYVRGYTFRFKEALRAAGKPDDSGSLARMSSVAFAMKLARMTFDPDEYAQTKGLYR